MHLKFIITPKIELIVLYRMSFTSGIPHLEYQKTLLRAKTHDNISETLQQYHTILLFQNRKRKDIDDIE